MMRKTKERIIDETVAFYSEDFTRLAVEPDGFGVKCEYCTQDGRKCAVGRYMDETNTHGRYYGEVTYLLDHDAELQKISVDDVLIDEVKGHDPLFWEDLQNLHDGYKDHFDDDGLIPYFDDDGITSSGLEKVAEIKGKWCKETAGLI